MAALELVQDGVAEAVAPNALLTEASVDRVHVLCISMKCS
jgi:hypothetical protein